MGTDAYEEMLEYLDGQRKSLMICVKDWMSLVLRNNTRLALRHTRLAEFAGLGKRERFCGRICGNSFKDTYA